MGSQLDGTRFGEERLGTGVELAFEGRLAGQPVLQGRAAEQDGGRLVIGRHATPAP